MKRVISGLLALRRTTTGLVLIALIAAVLVVPANSAGAAGGPVVTSLDPGSGPVGTPVKLTGSGFVAGDMVQFPGVDATPARVNAAGTRITTTVPLFALSGPINVIDPTGLEAQSPQPFTVTQGLVALPAKQVPGHTVTFEGSGLAPNSQVTLTWNGTPFDEADTNGSGGFSTQYRLPKNEPPGPYYVGVEAYEFAPIVFLVLSTWPEFGNNPDHTGLDGFEPFLTESHVAAGLTYKFGIYPEIGFPYAKVSASPVVVGDLALVMESTALGGLSYLVAFNLNTKKFLWASTSFGASSSAPAVSGSLVYVASTDEHVYAFPTSCGNPCSPSWTSTKAGGEFVDSSPTVYNGNVFVGNTDGTVYDYPTSCGLSTCSPRWESTATGGPIYGSPAVDNGFVFVGSSDHSVYAYVQNCASTCSPLWKSESTGGAVDGSPVVDASMVYVLSEDGKLYAFPEQCTTTGCPWTWVSKLMATGINATPSVDNGDVYIGDGTTVYGYPESCSTTCAPVWQSEAEPGTFQGASAIANGVVFVDMPFTTAPSGDVYAFNTADSSCSPSCAPIWQSGAYSLTTDPSVSEGLVFVGNVDDTLDAFG